MPPLLRERRGDKKAERAQSVRRQKKSSGKVERGDQASYLPLNFHCGSCQPSPQLMSQMCHSAAGTLSNMLVCTLWLPNPETHRLHPAGNIHNQPSAHLELPRLPHHPVMPIGKIKQETGQRICYKRRCKGMYFGLSGKGFTEMSMQRFFPHLE